EMGFELQHRISVEHFILRKHGLLSVFPHGPIFFWFIVGDYVRERRRMTGSWFAQYALIFVKRSIDYVLAYSDQLTLGLPGEQETVVIDKKELREMRRGLERLISEHARLRSRS
ncbi:MAG: hypothetical protein WAN97_01910, partial [Candidatus Acidiferrales bacterium]